MSAFARHTVALHVYRNRLYALQICILYMQAVLYKSVQSRGIACLQTRERYCILPRRKHGMTEWRRENYMPMPAQTRGQCMPADRREHCKPAERRGHCMPAERRGHFMQAERKGHCMHAERSEHCMHAERSEHCMHAERRGSLHPSLQREGALYDCRKRDIMHAYKRSEHCMRLQR
jgi:hypothetical protein